MTCKEITVAEWNELNYRKDTYFANGCIFDEKTDNLIAFGWYEDELHEAGKFYKILEKQNYEAEVINGKPTGKAILVFKK